MSVRIYRFTERKRLSDGTYKEYQRSRIYISNEPVIDDKTIKSICDKRNSGVPVIRIMKDTGLSRHRINKILKKHNENPVVELVEKELVENKVE